MPMTNQRALIAGERKERSRRCGVDAFTVFSAEEHDGVAFFEL
jgi:hypothetical protein